jgi:hypothetical protein
MSYRYLLASHEQWKRLQDSDKHIVLETINPYRVGDILIIKHGNLQITRRVFAVLDQGLDGRVVLTLDAIQ